MKNIHYLDILKKSWLTTWNHKYLWWFGLFLAIGGNGINFNVSGGEWNGNVEKTSGRISEFFAQHASALIGIGIVVAAMLLALFILKTFAQAGMLISLDALEKHCEVNFKAGMKKGKAYFWKLFGMDLIVGFLVACIMIVLAVPVIFLFYAGSVAFGILAAILAVLICIPLFVLAAFIGKYARFYIVLSQMGVRESLELGYRLFRKNIFESILMVLFFVPIGMMLAIAVIILLLAVGLVFAAQGLVLYALLAKMGIAVAIVSGALVFLGAALLISSVYAAFHQATWFYFFKEIASPKDEEGTEEIIEKVPEKSLPSPEGA